MHLTLYGEPRTKKNSARILRARSGAPFVAPSKAYTDYERACGRFGHLLHPSLPV